MYGLIRPLKRVRNSKVWFLRILSPHILDDVVNIIGNWDRSITGTPSITINSMENLLIHHPDYLVTATSLSEGSVCRRKPLISNLVRPTSNTLASSVWGRILHEVVESCLSENRWDKKFIDDETDDVLRKHLQDLLKIETTIEEATDEIKKRASGLAVFSKRYIGKFPKVGKPTIIGPLQVVTGISAGCYR